ncbi:hypothetical protein [Bacillus paralicheniformis]|uniref:hypothetical protein n=1 Tax=Bacillus paralicheniformis TaxID=1648923 RepID=UPI001FD66F02|nr:hypothetical protein [Bacillus paralicheniformis]MCJ8223672.1 hypothetical protein [Bacillus paralicheniformis]
MQLKKFYSRYEGIMQDTDIKKRDIQLSQLMTELERVFNIPILRNPVWEEKNKPVIALYRKISMSRELK